MKKTFLLFSLFFSFFTAFSQSNQWTWVQGDTSIPQFAIYGIKGVADGANKPGARQAAVSWTDAAGDMWLFGGYGNNASAPGYLNDLWKYSRLTNQWTWVGGDKTLTTPGVYGAQGTASAANKPGARYSAAAWTDAGGNFWLFGGISNAGYLNDLWMYSPLTGYWTWVNGDNISNQLTVYGVQGIPAAGNKPGSRRGSASWTDAAGNLWLFGGTTTVSNGAGNYNDLWKYTLSTNQWTWVSGDNTVNQTGVYKVKGVADGANKPGARQGSVGWTDNLGNLWLFGGNSNGYLNDLWKFTPSTALWTWMSGDSTANQTGIYGTRGIADAANKPEARQSPVSWTDAAGSLWLFGGSDYGAGGSRYLGDLWKFTPSTGLWTWMSGDSIPNQRGIYGTKGGAAAANKPGGRLSLVSWTDPQGELWLAGGTGFAASGSGILNDLWKYSPSTDKWTWMSGDAVIGSLAIYGARGVAAFANKPGGRRQATHWSDTSGNLWLFGGNGYIDTADILSNGSGYLNDIWKYAPATGQWTWISGEKTLNPPGLHGSKGVANSISNAGARIGAAGWTDPSGNFLLFGGYGFTLSDFGFSITGYSNDLWKYAPSTGLWTWLSGDSTVNQPGVYGTQGNASALNAPRARNDATSWTDAAGDLWLFGGITYSSTTSEYLNDLWKFSLSSGSWTWMGGDMGTNQTGVYGIQGVAAPSNKPCARNKAASWTDNSGNLWLFGGSVYTAGDFGNLNDLWKYNTSTRQWTWISGDTTTFRPGIYGAKGVASSVGRPGSRYGATSWKDASGNLWLFGGIGNAANGSGFLNDTWKYDPSALQWTWMNGDSTINSYGMYGTQGVAAPGNGPGGRYSAAGWTGASGNLWLFGGTGYAASGLGNIQDLWRFSTSGSSLPVQFSSFTARKQQQTVVLSWTTGQEQNSRFFIIERSTDGATYDSIGTVAAMGTASSVSRYAFVDNHPLPGPDIYRLKQVDHDGKFIYSAQVKVVMEEEAVQFAILQNPVKDALQIRLRLPAAQHFTLLVRDINGRLLFSREYAGKEGSAVYKLPVNQLANGTYFINLQTDKSGSTKTFIRQ